MSPGLSPSDDFADNPIGHADTVVLDDGYGPRIVVSKALLARIFAQVDAGVRILPRGGAEIGGLLVGSSGQGDDFAQGNDLLVEEVVPLKIDYRFGPMFRMSPVDLDNVEKTMVSVHEDETKTVVGFYRSLTRGDDKLRESDAEILEAIRLIHPSFGDFQCFFVLAPLSRFEISLCVFVRNGNSWEHSQKITLQTETPQSGIVASKPAAPKLVQELPSAVPEALFNQETLSTSIQDARSSGLAAASAKPAPIVRQTEEPAVAVPRPMSVSATAGTPGAAKPSRWTGRQSAIAIYASIGLACILALVGVFKWIGAKQAPAPSRQAETAPATPRMGFAANWVGSTWKLTWDRDAVDALKPVGATLSIQDGANQQQIELTAADLSSGELYYNPQTAELAFRLEVQRNGAPPADERVRVLAGVKPVNRVPQTTWQTPPTKESGVTSGPAPNATSSAVGTAKAVTNTPPAAPRVANLPANSSPKEVAAISTASIPTPPVTILALPILPVLNSAVNLPDAPAPPTAQASTAVPPPTTPVQPAQQPQQPKQTPPSSAGTPLPIPGPTTATNTSRPPTPAPSAYVGPKPTKQASPMAPRGVATSGQTQVEVRVAIDAKGKVTKVTPVGTNLNIGLVSAAAKAAEFWEFDPARDNGRPVASEMTLIFRF